LFSQRVGFCIDQDLDVKDYLKIRDINRKNLTKFLKRIQRNKFAGDEQNVEFFDSQSSEQDYSKSC
jgi:hypothetical protein